MESNAGLQDLMSYDNVIKDYIKKNEGYSPDIYKDTKKIPTTGYGFNIKAEHIKKLIPNDVLNGRRALKQDESNQIFEKVYNQAVSDARQYVGKDIFDRLPNNQKQAVIDMAYNMGITRLNGFEGMKKAIVEGNPEAIRRELLDSNYARVDVPDRALRNADLVTQKSSGLASLPSKKMSDFDVAFASARKSGKKTFEFGGKLYKVEMK